MKKKINLIPLLFLSCVLFCCQPKKEKKQPVIYNSVQNYKFDDDDLVKKDTNEFKHKKQNLDKNKKGKVAVEN